MELAIHNINPAVKKFFIEQIDHFSDFQRANEFLKDRSGIHSFFESQADLLKFLALISSDSTIPSASERCGYGDFQTPRDLTDLICSRLVTAGILPEIIIEPTFGKGSFIISALAAFPCLKKVYAVEIQESYIWHTKFSIVEFYLTYPRLQRPEIYLYRDDIFKFTFNDITDSSRILILGNPPWVTNSTSGTIGSTNLPLKRNIKAYQGIDALTGKSNFDISESIVMNMLQQFAHQHGHLAMLLKNTVIKNLIYDLPATAYPIHNLTAQSINTQKYFHATVEASLFTCELGARNGSFTCKMGSFHSSSPPSREFGWLDTKFIADTNAYVKQQKYDGRSPYIWRQGVKHDCANIMELTAENNHFINGLKEKVYLEHDLIFGLIKGSDLAQPVITTLRRFVIITQKQVGADTADIARKFPLLYEYLAQHQAYFDQRKSRVYQRQPRFSLFGIGAYAFKHYKVAISSMYKRTEFSLILPHNGKPVMLDDTCYFLSFDDIAEAIFSWALLNSPMAQGLLRAITFDDAKRKFTKAILMRLAIDRMAQDVNYAEIQNQIKSHDVELLTFVDQDQWHLFQQKLDRLIPSV